MVRKARDIRVWITYTYWCGADAVRSGTTMVNLVVRLGARELVSTIQAVSLLTLVLAEPFYQRRDHLDQNRYLKVHNDNVVKDRDDAEVSMTSFL